MNVGIASMYYPNQLKIKWGPPSRAFHTNMTGCWLGWLETQEKLCLPKNVLNLEYMYYASRYKGNCKLLHLVVNLGETRCPWSQSLTQTWKTVTRKLNMKTVANVHKLFHYYCSLFMLQFLLNFTVSKITLLIFFMITSVKPKLICFGQNDTDFVLNNLSLYTRMIINNQ